jgi:hypothetical protein
MPSSKGPASVQKIRIWLKRRGYSLVEGEAPINQVCFSRKQVTLQKSLSEKSKAATLLHECGHILVYMSRKRSKKTKVSGASWTDWISLARSRCKHKEMLCLQEEMVAWDRGEKLRQRLRIRLPRRFYVLTRTKALMSYVRYSAGWPGP